MVPLNVTRGITTMAQSSHFSPQNYKLQDSQTTNIIQLNCPTSDSQEKKVAQLFFLTGYRQLSSNGEMAFNLLSKKYG
ncbi:hypothetical protein P7K49_031087 [Saguinus oedipus]|uniref:Uncharacterized protein n=1 Tax=Saguinus oedipus TaxID=9490 RepID=A0ABQ9U411_SAGOE|nr:hypothetical protein P7K49_031087 [Saguinus oedipus]